MMKGVGHIWRMGTWQIQNLVGLSEEQKAFGRPDVDEKMILQEFFRRTDRLLSFHYIFSIWHDTDGIENTAPNYFCCVCIGCRGNLFTEPLSSNDKRDAQTHRELGDLISRFLFFKNKGSSLKMGVQEVWYEFLSWIQLAKEMDQWGLFVTR
jgi:hypothetical protein